MPEAVFGAVGVHCKGMSLDGPLLPINEWIWKCMPDQCLFLSCLSLPSHVFLPSGRCREHCGITYCIYPAKTLAPASSSGCLYWLSRFSTIDASRHYCPMSCRHRKHHSLLIIIATHRKHRSLLIIIATHNVYILIRGCLHGFMPAKAK
jgi:hypothetical protein